MKLTFLLAVFSCSFIYAQKHVSFGLKLGVNRSAVMNDGYPGYNKTGLNGGVFSSLQLTKNCTGQLEILYTNKGSNYKYDNTKVLTGPYYIKLNYIELPLLIQFHLKKFIAGFGIGVAYLINQKEMPENFRNPNDVSHPFTQTEISGNIGIGYSFNEKLGCNLRYTNSILPIRKLPTSQLNSVFTLSLFYIFKPK